MLHSITSSALASSEGGISRPESVVAEFEFGLSNPMVGSFPGCCARA
jgi:hypothetical protein